MNKKNDWDFGSILLIVIAFVAFWPLGLVLLAAKLGVFNALKAKKPDTDFAVSARMGKYKLMTEGRASESVEYLASAVGVPYATALHELQLMISKGEFGPDAYINFVDKTIVLQKNTAAAARRAQDAAAAKPGAARTAPSAASPAASPAASSAAPSAASGAKPAGKAAAPADSKNPFGSTPAFLLAGGLLLLLIGLVTLSRTLDEAVYMGIGYELWPLIRGVFLAAGGGVCLGVRGGMRRRAARFKVYSAAAEGKSSVPLADLASAAGIAPRALRRDLDVMIGKGLLGPTAYIDVGAGTLILDPKAARAPEPSENVPDDGEERYKAILRQIRQLNDDIPDPDVSLQIDRIEELTAKIFRAVSEKPEKLPQIKSFMSYYLPTTLKLLRSYADFEKSGADGENVRQAKEGISGILNTLAEGFSKQLDKLYASDAIDISSDIDVLENMMKRDGLSDSGSGFGAASGGQTMGGH